MFRPAQHEDLVLSLSNFVLSLSDLVLSLSDLVLSLSKDEAARSRRAALA